MESPSPGSPSWQCELQDGEPSTRPQDSEKLPESFEGGLSDSAGRKRLSRREGVGPKGKPQSIALDPDNSHISPPGLVISEGQHRLAEVKANQKP